jgi:hypothetical protein
MKKGGGYAPPAILGELLMLFHKLDSFVKTSVSE